MADEQLNLTDRQRDVLALIDRRMTHKQIAAELGISPARVSQYVRTLKDRMGVETLAEIVERYRDTEDFPEETYNKFSSQSFKVPAGAHAGQEGSGGDPVQLIFADSQPGLRVDDWPALLDDEGDVRIVPGVLDGRHATLWRIGAMLAVAMGVLIVLIVGLTAAATVSDFLG